MGILSGDSLLYVWDVIFMHNWTKVQFHSNQQSARLSKVTEKNPELVQALGRSVNGIENNPHRLYNNEVSRPFL